MKSLIYNNLAARIVNKKEYENLNNSINKYYNVSNTISYYNPNLNLLTNYFKEEKTFNNKNRLLQLIKKKKRIDTTGFVFKAKIMTEYRSMYHTDIFLKELPILPILSVSSYYQHIETAQKTIEPRECEYINSIYNLNSSNNIEIFVNYLVSRLTELNISPHFCLFYGCVNVIMDKFTYDITSDDNITDKILNQLLDSDITKYISNKEGEFMEYKNLPVYLLATEKADLDIDHLYDNNKLDYNFIKSIIFQIFSTVITMQNIFGIKHNDLHLSNVMLSITDKTHLYYKYENKYFKVPTYGYIVKLIDWGRATYDFNGKKGINEIFSYYGDCFGQYREPRINNRHRKPLLTSDNKWTDIMMVSHSLLNLLKDYRKSDIGQFLYEQITYNNECLDVNQFDFDLYRQISLSNIVINPRKILSNSLFKKYQITLEDISEDEIIYTIEELSKEDLAKQLIKENKLSHKRKLCSK